MTSPRILDNHSVPLYRLLNILMRHRPQIDEDRRHAIASAYTTYGALSRIGNLYPFAQAWLETGGFTSSRWHTGYNPAGIGATDDGAWGNVFASPAEGIAAQYGHLLCYAATDTQLAPAQLLLSRFSPRRHILDQKRWRGIAVTWHDLSGKWATDPLYGEKIEKLDRQFSL